MFKKAITAILTIPVILGISIAQAPKANADVVGASIDCFYTQEGTLALSGITRSSLITLAYNYRARFSDGPKIGGFGILPLGGVINTGLFQHPNPYTNASAAALDGAVLDLQGIQLFEAYTSCPPRTGTVLPSSPSDDPCKSVELDSWCMSADKTIVYGRFEPNSKYIALLSNGWSVDTFSDSTGLVSFDFEYNIISAGGPYYLYIYKVDGSNLRYVMSGYVTSIPVGNW